MKSKIFLALTLASQTFGLAAFAAAAPVVAHCEIKVSGDPSATRKRAFHDTKSLAYIGAPTFIEFVDKNHVKQMVQLNYRFGTKNRVLEANWAFGEFLIPGESYGIRPEVSKIEVPLAPGKPIKFQFGDDELSPNPAITLTCTLDPNAPAWDEKKTADLCDGCSGGGASASN